MFKFDKKCFTYFILYNQYSHLYYINKLLFQLIHTADIVGMIEVLTRKK